MQRLAIVLKPSVLKRRVLSQVLRYLEQSKVEVFDIYALEMIPSQVKEFLRLYARYEEEGEEDTFLDGMSVLVGVCGEDACAEVDALRLPSRVGGVMVLGSEPAVKYWFGGK
jgi:nucleoside diphosphate kinase